MDNHRLYCKNEFLGEFLGTFVLTLFGCGAVAVSVLYNAHSGLFQIALIWGIGVTLAIYLTRHLSCAHLNPAVSIAMAISGRMTFRKVPGYILAQLLGAFAAGGVLLALFWPVIADFEVANNIVRGTDESIRVARMFGEYYTGIPFIWAVAAEAFGTFLLVLIIFSLTENCNVGRPDNALTPCFIGLGVTSVICLIAPLTQAGLNPARDFGPRLVAIFAGWGDAAYPDSCGGFFWVYILGPVIGGALAALLFVHLIERGLKQRSCHTCGCFDHKCDK